MAAETSKVSLKLMIHTESRRVVYAEADKDFVGFLFYIIALPVGTFIPLLNQEMVGSLGNIYHSIANLSTTYLRPSVDKDTLLKPKAYFNGGGARLPLHLPNIKSPLKVYRCCKYVSHDSNEVCSCRKPMIREAEYFGPPSANNPHSGASAYYVREKVMYMVMDDLAVKPLSITSLTALLNKLNIKEIGILEEKVVDFGRDEVLKLLKASLLTKSILTDVFLPVLKEEVDCQQEIEGKF